MCAKITKFYSKSHYEVLFATFTTFAATIDNSIYFFLCLHHNVLLTINQRCDRGK